ncbi:MAG: hypothetical protein RIC14_09360 [Filomicrobium sp.]
MQDFQSRLLPILLDKIYAAAVEPERWPDAMAALSDTFGGAPCALHFEDESGLNDSLMVGAGVADKSAEAFQAHYWKVNPYPTIALQKYGPGQTLCALECVSAEDLKSDEFFNDWMRPNHWTPEHIGSVLFNSDGRTGVLSVAPFSANALENLDDDLTAMRAIVPHFQRAIELNRLLVKSAESKDSVDSFLEFFDAAAIMISDAGIVQRYNATAASLLDAGHTIEMDALGVPFCKEKKSQKRFSTALTMAGRQSGLGTSVPFRVECFEGERRYAGLVLNLRENLGELDSFRIRLLKYLHEGPSRVILLKEMVGVQTIAPDNIRSLLGYTHAEARLVSALAAGQSMTDYAKQTGVSRDTTKSQLSSVFEKSNVRSQTELLALLANLRDILKS